MPENLERGRTDVCPELISVALVHDSLEISFDLWLMHGARIMYVGEYQSTSVPLIGSP